ncbi:MAG: phosphopantothenoylcysteine decarboxylase [Tepidisphaeraceae bacterium]|jgi:phosphopantothenoylcysteine decarboxylase/phosphopantothenate--cysteine ligase
MRILLTAGPTHEPIDPVRYIGNRSSGRMGAALAQAAQRAGHGVTLILGPVTVAMPADIPRIDVETADQMLQAVLREFPQHDLLIMAAAVSDYRPKSVAAEKLGRHGGLVLELEATPDIVAAAGKLKRPDQRTVGFSLEAAGDLDRARRKLTQKNLDLIVYNPASTIGSEMIQATLLWPGGRSENVTSRPKAELADILIQRCIQLLAGGRR